MSDLIEIFQTIEWVMVHGGWVVFGAATLYMLYELYIEHIQLEWYNKLEWVFLKITVPPENERSPLAFENIFDELHAVQEALNWSEIHLEGQFQIWFTWEITSIGGMIGNYVRILPKFRDTLESAIYSEFPAAEIAEAEDYFDQLPKYDPDTSPYDIFALTWKYTTRTEYPIKTYRSFEHPTAETIVDPIAGLWEEMGKISPYEMFILQFVLRPVGDEWKDHARELVKKLKGVPEEHGHRPDFVGGIMGWFQPFIDIIFDALLRPDFETDSKMTRVKEEPPSLMLHLTENEKQIITQVENKISRWCYQVKIHGMYIAPKEKYNPTLLLRSVIGSFKAFGTESMNTLKPVLKRWTRVKYAVFKNWEKPATDFRLKWRKRKYFRYMKSRFWFHGQPANIMSPEELATLIHFPQLTVTVPHIAMVEVAKEQPPANLPINPEL